MKDQVNIGNDSLEEFLKNDLGDFLSDTKEISKNCENLALAPAGSSSELVMQSLERFLEQGSSVLETMTVYCNNMPDAESVSAFASLIASMSGAMNNIANVFKREQDHINKLELEEQKHKNKLIEIEFRETVKARAKETVPGETMEQADTLLEYNTADIIAQIVDNSK